MASKLLVAVAILKLALSVPNPNPDPHKKSHIYINVVQKVNLDGCCPGNCCPKPCEGRECVGVDTDNKGFCYRPGQEPENWVKEKSRDCTGDCSCWAPCIEPCEGRECVGVETDNEGFCYRPGQEPENWVKEESLNCTGDCSCWAPSIEPCEGRKCVGVETDNEGFCYRPGQEPENWVKEESLNCTGDCSCWAPSIGCCLFGGICYAHGTQLPDVCTRLTCTNGEWVHEDGTSIICSKCWIHNDPHFQNWFGTTFDWHGTCSYSLAQDGISRTPIFGVYGKFEKCGDGIHGPSCLEKITFENDASSEITMEGNVIKYNSTEITPSSTPMLLGYGNALAIWKGTCYSTSNEGNCYCILGSQGLMIQYCGWSMNIWAYRNLEDTLYGLCGYLSSNRADQFTDRNGTIFPKIEENFAKSWQTSACPSSPEGPTVENCDAGGSKRDEYIKTCSANIKDLDLTETERNIATENCAFDRCVIIRSGSKDPSPEDWLKETRQDAVREIGIRKSVTDFSSNNSFSEVYVCEFDDLYIACDVGDVIKVTQANYGRTSNKICNDHHNVWPVNCRSEISYKVLTERCNGQNSCTVPASNLIFRDPCGNVPKYLEARYVCEPDPTWSETSLGCVVRHTDKSFTTPTLEVCKEKCLEETDFVCESVEYWPPQQECQLSKTRSTSDAYIEPCYSPYETNLFAERIHVPDDRK